MHPVFKVHAGYFLYVMFVVAVLSVDEKYAYSFGKDVERMMFDTSRKKIWRILLANEDYSLCQSYPRHHIVPASITDEQIKSVAGFRSGKRIPSVVWRYVDGGWGGVRWINRLASYLVYRQAWWLAGCC